MEERFNVISRWLVALTVVFIPLSMFVLISGPWSANFGAHQWTRYLLFASWILLAISLIIGMANLINLPLNGEQEIEIAAAATTPDIDIEVDEEEDKKQREDRRRKKKETNYTYTLLMTQGASFLAGMILYVIFISWMILPYIPLRSSV